MSFWAWGIVGLVFVVESIGGFTAGAFFALCAGYLCGSARQEEQMMGKTSLSDAQIQYLDRIAKGVPPHQGADSMSDWGGLDSTSRSLHRRGMISGNPESLTSKGRAALIGSSAVTGGVLAVHAERVRQIEVEGWTEEHDLGHTVGELANAAASYAVIDEEVAGSTVMSKALWPWAPMPGFWKPGERRRNLEKAGALIAAAIDRLDKEQAGGGGDT